MSDTLTPPTSLSPAHQVDYGRRNLMIISTSLLVALGTLAVALRAYSRGIVIKALGADDWTMFAAWFIDIVYLAILGESARLGTGLHAVDMRPEWLTPVLKMVLVIQAVYYICIYLIKTSILLFYIRFARNANPAFHLSAKSTIHLLTLFLGLCLLVVFLQCRPLEKAWLPAQYAAAGRCIDSTAFFYSTSIFNILTDVWILVLPLRLLWRIQRPRFEKVALLGVFAMGVFACIASCVRLYSIKLFTLSPEPLWDAVHVNIWSMVEINIAIVCASVPALKAIFGMHNHNHHHQQRPRASPPSDDLEGSSSSSKPNRLIRSKNRHPLGMGGSVASTAGLGMGESEDRGGGGGFRQMVEAKEPVEFTSARAASAAEEEEEGEVKDNANANAGGGIAEPDYGYGVQAIGTGHDHGGVSEKEGGGGWGEGRPEAGVIVYQRDVEVRSEWRSPNPAGGRRDGAGREVDVEDGERYGGRPGGRRGMSMPKGEV